jgi:ABC-type transport system involved in multi-copper enzyme maturation permease subunit
VIARKTWRELRVMALAYLLILELLCVPVLLWWPDIYDVLQRSPFIRNLPMFVQPIGAGITNNDSNVAYRSWVALMLFLRSTNLVGVAAAVLFGTGLFARERENQTFELLLSRPVARGAILWHKLWPTTICLVAPLYLVNASAIFWSATIGYELPPGPLFQATTHAAVFLCGFLFATTWVSVRMRVQAHVAAVVGAFAVLQLGLYLTQRIRPYTLFRLVDFDWYGPMLLGNTRARQMFDAIHGPGFTTWLLLACAVFYGLAWRDLRRAEP